MQRSTFQTNLWKLASAFSVEITPDKAEVYWEDLGHISDEQFVVACTRARREWDKPFALPPIATLLRYVAEGERAAGTALNGETAWAQLWRDVISQYSEANNRAVSERLRKGGPGYPWPDDLAKEIVRNHLGFSSAAVHSLATIENDYERDKYRKLFVRLYDERSGTAQAVERSEQAIDAPNVRRIGAVGE